MDLLAVARAASTAPSPPHPPGAADLLLHGLTANFNGGYAPGGAGTAQALGAFGGGMPADQELRWLSLAIPAAVHLRDEHHCWTLCDRYIQLAREVGALSELALALSTSGFSITVARAAHIVGVRSSSRSGPGWLLAARRQARERLAQVGIHTGDDVAAAA